jgi:hypothetical protein
MSKIADDRPDTPAPKVTIFFFEDKKQPYLSKFKKWSLFRFCITFFPSATEGNPVG